MTVSGPPMIFPMKMALAADGVSYRAKLWAMILSLLVKTMLTLTLGGTVIVLLLKAMSRALRSKVTVWTGAGGGGGAGVGEGGG